MRRPPRLWSSTAVVLIAILSGIAAMPVALCASEGRRANCATAMPRQASAHDHGCHKSQAPPASLSCCCDVETAPTSVPAITIVADHSLTVAVSAVPALAMRTAWSNRFVETTALQVHTPPLFTLHSAFLI